MTTSASTPSSAAAYATAWAWLPAETAITPACFSSGVKVLRRLRAPRDLNEPVRWNSSHFRRVPSVRELSIGVRPRRAPIVSRARRTSSRLTTLAHRFEEEDRRGGGGVEAVGEAAEHRDGHGKVGDGE